MRNGIALRSNRRTAPHPLELNRPGSHEKIFNNAGEINASDAQEVIRVLGNLMQNVSSGKTQFTLANENTSNRRTEAEVAEERKEVVAAYNDRSNSSPWIDLGSAIGAEVSEVSDREGFARRLLVRGDVAQGSFPRVRIRVKNTTAIAAVSPAANQPIFARDKYLFPPEFYITANVRIEERDLQQGAGDLMEEGFFNTQEQIMRKEDQIWKSLADQTVGVFNPLQVLAGGLTPTSLTAMRGLIIQWGIPAQTLVMATDLWNDIIGNAAAFGQLFDPVTQFEIIQTGYLGTLLGLGIITDAFRVPQLRVLNSGELYVVGTPDQHGAYTDRGPVVSVPQDQFADGTPSRGWYFYELISMVVHNARSIVKGIRS